uniref:Putative ovule protein n=1 Tax=Solanum chacoense TaxID=4108 RepID=A0A0V0GGP6_SOLCH
MPGKYTNRTYALLFSLLVTDSTVNSFCPLLCTDTNSREPNYRISSTTLSAILGKSWTAFFPCMLLIQPSTKSRK